MDERVRKIKLMTERVRKIKLMTDTLRSLEGATPLRVRFEAEGRALRVMLRRDSSDACSYAVHDIGMLEVIADTLNDHRLGVSGWIANEIKDQARAERLLLIQEFTEAMGG